MNNQAYIESNIKQIKKASYLSLFNHPYNRVFPQHYSSAGTFAISKEFINTPPSIKIFSNEGNILRTLNLKNMHPKETIIHNMSFLRNAMLLVTEINYIEPNNYTEMVSIFNTLNGKLLKSFPLPGPGIIGNVISLSNNQLAFTNDSQENIQILNCTTGKILRKIPTKDYPIETMQVLPNGTLFTVQQSCTEDLDQKSSLFFRIYEPETGLLLKSFPQKAYHSYCLVFPEGNVALLSSCARSIQFFNTTKGKVFYEEKCFEKDLTLAKFHTKAIEIYENKDLKEWINLERLAHSTKYSCPIF